MAKDENFGDPEKPTSFRQVVDAKVLDDSSNERRIPVSKKCSMEFAKAAIFAPRGPTGHSNFRKVRFAMSLSSCFMIMTVSGSAKEIYIEKFGASATVMGVLWMVLSYWGVFAGLIGGALQDMQVLSKCFPLKSWGRRAPFFLTHLGLAAGAASLVYIPDLFTKDSGFLYVWFAALTLLVFWGIGSCMTAFECARQEIYPFKEERIVVEGFSKYSAMAGGGAGTLIFMLFSAMSGIALRLGMSACYILPLGLLSLEAVPVIREARIASSDGTESFRDTCAVLLEVLPCRQDSNRALQHLMAMAWWDGAYGSLIAGHMFYYVTYVLQPDNAVERTFFLGASGFIAGLTESVLNIIYMCTFGSGDARKDKSGRSDAQLLHFVVGCRVLNALSTMLLMGAAEPSLALLCVWAFTCRVGVCGFSFWRISAKCWLVDEDCLNSPKSGLESPNSTSTSPTSPTLRKRREGVIFGAVSLTRNLAGATFSSLALLGVGLAGLNTVNCEERCESFLGEKSACEQGCFLEVVHQQPDSLRLYCRLMIGFAAPVCELLLSLHAFWFPIKGLRLRRLYYSVMEGKGDHSYLPQANANPLIHEEIISEIAAEKAGSIMVLGPHNPEVLKSITWQEQLARTISAVRKRPLPSCAVVFDLTDTENGQEQRGQGMQDLTEHVAQVENESKEADQYEDEEDDRQRVPSAEGNLQIALDPEKVETETAVEMAQPPVGASSMGCQMCLPANCIDHQPG